MAVLTAAKRKKIPTKQFGLKSERKYPMPDKAHAANAKARAAQQYKKGNLSKSQYDSINAMANKKLDSNIKSYVKSRGY